MIKSFIWLVLLSVIIAIVESRKYGVEYQCNSIGIKTDFFGFDGISYAKNYNKCIKDNIKLTADIQYHIKDILLN